MKLIMQFHFVALERVLPSTLDLPKPLAVQTNQPELTDLSGANEITDNEIEEGDAYIDAITGGPSPTMLYKENPAASVINIAPCEGEKPTAILSDPKFEEMANPTKFPYGEGGF